MTDAAETSSFRIDLVNLCLWRSKPGSVDERLKLPPKTFDVLRYLIENSGRLVTHDELLEAVWGNVHVQPEVVKGHILAIRTALGDKADNRRIIETQRGRGYRFIGSIKGLSLLENPPGTTPELGVIAGRAMPLGELLTALQRAISGETQTVFVSGEPGIGKTTLIQHFLAQTQSYPGLVVTQGHCIEGFAGVEPYYPILEALAGLCKGATGAETVRALVGLAPTWAVQMPAQISIDQRSALPLQIEGARSRMVREATNLFETLARERPLIVVLEDLHWADYATIDFLSAICRRRSAVKLMLIATYRPEDLKTARHPLKQMTRDLAVRNYCSEIELGPLPEPAIADILASDPDGEPASAEFTQFLQERSGGNPLFIRITLDYLVERGAVARTRGGWRLLTSINKLAFETPPTLGRLLESRIDQLPDEHQRVLEAASVTGLRFDPATTARAADMDEQPFEAICEEFHHRTFAIRRDELLTLPNQHLVRTYAFRHAYYRQVLYDRMGETRRAWLHQAIGARLEEIYPPDKRCDIATLLAQHFASGRDWPRGLHYLRSALRVANSRLARRDALAILDLAAELAANLPDSARSPAETEFLEHRAAIQAASHDPKAKETYEQLAERAASCGNIDARIRALLGLSYAVSWQDLSHSLRVIDEVLVLSQKQDDPIKQDLTRIIAYVRRIWGSGWSRVDARECEEALARLRKHGDSFHIARAQIYFSMICMISTRYRDAHDLLEDSYRLLGESTQDLVEADLARAAWMHHIGVPWSLFSRGEFGAALAAFDSSIAAFDKSGDPSAAHSLQIYRAVLLFHAMDFEGVLQACSPVALQIVRPLKSHAGEGIGLLPIEKRMSLIFAGLAELGLGNNPVALAYLHSAEELMERQPIHLDWYWRLALEWGMVNLLIANGDQTGAQLRAQRLCDLAAQTDERVWQALAWEARARAVLLLDEPSKAINHVANALAACEGGQVPLAEWRVHATAAAAYKNTGDLRRARTHAHLSARARKRLAVTLPQGHSLRLTFERRSGSVSVSRYFGRLGGVAE
jgi:DNA-binding winged helix-turn-helix (wHTH) protein